jgi:hypothetical protein
MAYSIARVRALFGICASFDEQSAQIGQIGWLQDVSRVWLEVAVQLQCTRQIYTPCWRS